MLAWIWCYLYGKHRTCLTVSNMNSALSLSVLGQNYSRQLQRYTAHVVSSLNHQNMKKGSIFLWVETLCIVLQSDVMLQSKAQAIALIFFYILLAQTFTWQSKDWWIGELQEPKMFLFTAFCVICHDVLNQM